MENLSTSRFECYVTHDESIRGAETVAFEQEEGKRSSFMLAAPHEDAAVFGIEAPAHVCIYAVSSDDNQCVPFVLGGFEIVSNSRNLEIYISDENDKETYLTTCRGIKWHPEVNAGILASASPTNAIDHQQQRPPDDKWHKALMVIPGGPRTMKRIRFKMLSIRPPSNTKSLVHYVKLKGRLPVVERTPPQPLPHHHVNNTSADARFTTTSASPPQQQPLSISDVAAALAGVSMMVHSTEERLAKVLESSLVQLNLGISNRLQGVERVVGMQCYAIQQLQQQNAIILQQQQQILHEMREQRSLHIQILESLSILQLSDQLQTENEVIGCGMEDEDCKPPSRLLGVDESEGMDAAIPTGATIYGGELPHGDALDEDENHSLLSAESRQLELAPVVDDEDSKPPLRSRSFGNVVHNNLSPGAEVELGLPAHQADESSLDAAIVGREPADAEKEATEGRAEATSDSTNNITVAEDDDSKPPTRARVDDGALGSARRSKHGQEVPMPAITSESHPMRDIPCSNAEGAAEDDDERNCLLHIADEDEEAVDSMPVASRGVAQAAYGDSDRPPSRSRQGEDQNIGQMLVLEPPDKGCGGPHEVVTHDPGVDEN